VRVGRFGVEVAAFESVAVPALEAALTSDDVIVIDEIASMELASAAFTALVPEIMTGRQVVVATMHSRAHPVTDAIRRARVVEIINVTVDNRDGLPQLLLSRIMQR
jgi:nucleoside-triphosphatase